MPFFGSYLKRKFNNIIYENYDFSSTILEVLKDIKNQSEKNIIFTFLKSKKQIKKELNDQIKFFEDDIHLGAKYFSFSDV